MIELTEPKQLIRWHRPDVTKLLLNYYLILLSRFILTN